MQRLPATSDVPSTVRSLGRSTSQRQPESPADVLRRNQAALVELGRLSELSPGTSYRVGVLAPARATKKPPNAFRQVKSVDAARVPAVMLVRLVEVPMLCDGEQVLNPILEDDEEPETETVMEIELWRTDRVTSVIDLDAAGLVLPTAPGGWQEALYPPWLAQGLCR